MIEYPYNCEYCGEPALLMVDPSIGSAPQLLVEDCPVCCAPMEFTVRVDEDGDVEIINIRRANE